MKTTILALAVALCAAGTSLGERVTWNHVAATPTQTFRLAASQAGKASGATSLEFRGQLKESVGKEAYLFYQLVATSDGTSRVIWTAGANPHSDWITHVSFATADAQNVAGLVAVGRLTDQFYEIPLSASGPAEAVQDRLPQPSSHSFLSSSAPASEVDLHKLLGGDFVDGKVEDVRLACQNGTWLLHFAVSRPPPTSEKHTPVIDPERQITSIVLQKPVGAAGAAWSLADTVQTPETVIRCRRNQRQIVAAKEQWSLAEGRETGSPVDVPEVDEFIKNGHPQCPEGGEYTYGAVGEPVRCTVHGTLE